MRAGSVKCLSKLHADSQESSKETKVVTNRLVSLRCLYLQHPSGDHPPHKRLNVFLDDFEIGTLRYEILLLYGQQAAQHSVIAEEVRVGSSAYVRLCFEAQQLHGAARFLCLSKNVGGLCVRKRRR